MKYVLAPLADFTDAPFRRLCRECGADLCYSEMVSAPGLVHGSVQTLRMIETMPGEGPAAIQIFGASESDVAGAAGIVDAAASRAGVVVELNLNAGCPMSKVVRVGAGAKLVEDPGKAHRLLKAMAERTSLPVTLKTRLGPRPGDVRIFEMLDAARDAGAKGVVVHARYTSQLHGGPLDLDTLAEAVRRARVPVTGNGSVVDSASAAAIAATGVSAVMVGRAALARPWLFAGLKGGGAAPPDPVAMATRHLALILEFRALLAARGAARLPGADALAALKARTHLFRYFAGVPGAASVRARMNGVRTLADVRAVLADAAVPQGRIMV